jgi:hypothetical protein
MTQITSILLSIFNYGVKSPILSILVNIYSESQIYYNDLTKIYLIEMYIYCN